MVATWLGNDRHNWHVLCAHAHIEVGILKFDFATETASRLFQAKQGLYSGSAEIVWLLGIYPVCT